MKEQKQQKSAIETAFEMLIKFLAGATAVLFMGWLIKILWKALF